jgi:hypothetical protein
MIRQYLVVGIWIILWLPAIAGYQDLPGSIIEPEVADTGANLDSLIDTSSASQNQIVNNNMPQNQARGNILQTPHAAQFDSLSTPKIRKPWPTGALLLSVAIPGGGQFYNHQYIKFLLYGGTETYLIKYVSWRWKQMDEHWLNFKNAGDDLTKARQFALYEKKRDSRNTHIWLTALVVFVSMFDAYVDAHLADFNQTDKAFDAYIAPENDRVQLSLVYRF